jgi:DNA-directed RNA polymerase specialized sigma subunit
MLIAQIKQAALGNQQEMLNLIKQFDPLLKKYARKLYYPDAYCDLRLFFIDLIHYLADNKLKYPCDAYIVSYINKAVEHFYYKLLLRKHISLDDLPFASLSDEEAYLVESKLSVDDTYDKLLFDELKLILTDKEYRVIKKLFLENWQVIDIAKHYGVSRQSINKTKQRALSKIKRWYIEEKEKSHNY